MKYAEREGRRVEAQPGLSAICPSCKNAVIAKCGDQRVWHWSHRGARSCDTWAESETEWHRAWKNEFPKDWQEIVQISPSGEKHIADVKTVAGMVLEFQHSFLKSDERAARDAFYLKLVWVVDGLRRRRDAAQFQSSIGRQLFQNPPVFAARTDESALLRDWRSCRTPVYFDFGAGEDGGVSCIWRLDPLGREGTAYLSPVSRESFLRVHNDGLEAEDRFSEMVGLIVDNVSRSSRGPQPLPGFQQYLARSRGKRRR